MAYVKGQPFKPQFTDPATNTLMSNGKVEFYLTGTSTPTPYYTDSSGTEGGTSLTLDSGGKPSTDVFFNTAITYKLVVKNAAGGVVETLEPFRINDAATKPDVYTTVAALRGASTASVSAVQTLGYYTAGDGGGALYRADASDAVTADDGFLCIVSADGVRFKLQYSGAINLLWVGARADNATTDNMSALKKAFAAADTVVVPDPGVDSWYGVGDGTVELGDRQTLKFEGQAKIIRASSLSTDTSPVVWMKDNNASIIGDNIGGGLRSQAETPDGVVLLGARSMAVATNNMFHCIIENISVQGHQSGGNTSGSPTHGIKAHAPSLGGAFECYFNKIRNVKVDNVNYGVSLFGYANAWMLSDIWGQNTGNDHTGIGGALVWLNGAQETNISSIFLHTAPGSVGLKLSVLDNTANGGTTHTPRFTSARGITAEPGGNTRTLKVTDRVTNNYFEIQRNTTLGNELPSEFYEDNNVLVDRGYFANFSSILDSRVYLTQHKDQEATTRCFTDTAYISSIAAGDTHEAISLEVANGAHIEISYFGSGNAGAARSSGKVEYVADNASGVACSAIYSRYVGDIKPCTPQISGSIVSIPFLADYTGSAATLSVHIKVTSSNAPTVNRVYTAAASAGTALGASI